MAKVKPAPKADSLQDIAKIRFAPVNVDTTKIMSRKEFLAQADTAYTFIVVGAHLLTKSQDDLISCLRHLGSEGALGALNEVNDVQDWFGSFAKLTGTVSARLYVVASCIAAQEGA